MRRSDSRGPSAGSTDPDAAWAQIAARIEEVGRRLAAESIVSPEQTRLILAERARALAVPPVVQGDEPRLELLTLDCAGRRYALETRHVVAMARNPPTTPLPGSEPPVAAVVAWRGRILTALDLRPATAAGATAQPPLLIVLGGDRAEIGLLADGVGEITSVPVDRLRDVPDGPMRWRDYLRALTADAVAVLDGDILLQRHAIDH